MFHILKNFLGISFELTIVRKKQKKNRDEVFLSYLETRIADMEKNALLNRGRSYARESVCNYRKILRIWPEFERAAGVSGLRFSQITMDVYSGFMEWCDSRNYMESTKYHYIALVKAIMNSALEDGASCNTVQNSRSFVTRCSAPIYKKVYLGRDEISRLAAVDLNGDPLLTKVRDVFLAGCYCGQRFSDYSSLSLDDVETISIEGEEFKALRKIQKKTGKTVIIPMLDDSLLNIIRRWGGKMPKVSISALNTNIKTVCRMAGIDTRVTVYSNRGGRRVKESRYKYELVSSHTARRSYITNLYMDGRLSTEQIRSISGHSSEESFKRYLCQNQEDEAKEIIRRYIGKRGCSSR